MTRGFSTLSLLIGLAICASIMLVASAAILSQLRSLTSARAEHINVTRTDTISSLLEGVMHDLDSTTLAIAPRVHIGGRITNFDGTPNAINLRTDTLSPASDSDALSVYSLLTAQTLDIERIDAGSDSVRACSRYSENLSLDPLRTVLALSAHAIWEFKVITKKPRRAAKCVVLKLAATKSMLLPDSTQADLRWVRTIIPITRVYTIYLDQNGTLRYLGHSGISNIENQPIVTRLLGLKLALTVSTENLYILSANIQQYARTPHSFLATSKLARRSNLFSLLARP